jgi:hypothetical protein
LRTATPISFRHHAQREDALNGDLPTIPLTVIEQITDNFSELSKLGEGGFGPVTRVHYQIAQKLLSKGFQKHQVKVQASSKMK